MPRLIGSVIVALLVTSLMLAGTGCTSGSTAVTADPDANSSASTDEQSAGRELDESDLDGLEDWQQDLLADEGWDQPYIEPIPGTDVPVPADGPEPYPGG